MDFRIYIEDPYMDGEVHFLVNYPRDEYIYRVLCFPACNRRDLIVERTLELIKEGFIYLLETGQVIHGVRVLGKGYSSIIVVAYHARHGLGVLKIRRTDSRRDDLSREAEAMMRASGSGVTPRLYMYSRDYLFRELVNPVTCRSLEALLTDLFRTGDMDRVKQVIYEVLVALNRLDSIRIDHTELNRPGNHVFICPDGMKIIDWESARRSVKPSNLSSFISYLLYRFRYRSELISRLGLEREKILRLLRRYKAEYSLEALGEIIDSMHLV
ncbi:serine/threonine protein kinase [Desulfurococcus amylolyticus]|uniref:serine/threonine protein kinase n=1 Tax=Desulfurococcus amylolyticus TaxID=94694 RepID=UPI0023F10C2F|nr:serine/threonine protein kinase [Desulfurococcus amylolyticus]